MVFHIRNAPADAVRIDRKTPWGNPFIIGVNGDRSEVIAAFRLWVQTCDDAHATWIRAHVHELAGKDLACWCALDASCHCDVLLELAEEMSP